MAIGILIICFTFTKTSQYVKYFTVSLEYNCSDYVLINVFFGDNVFFMNVLINKTGRESMSLFYNSMFQECIEITQRQTQRFIFYSS